MAGTLDSFLSLLKSGVSTNPDFLKYPVGVPVVTLKLATAGKVDLPIVGVGNEVLKANQRAL